MRIVVAATLALVTMVIAGGCSSAPPPDPLSDVQRDSIRAALADSAWALVDGTVQTSPRPEVVVGPVLTRIDRMRAVLRCFSDRGFTVTAEGNGMFAYSSSQGASHLTYELTAYECTVQHPSLGEVAAALDADQLGDLLDYYTHFVRPCLAFAGLSTEAPPRQGTWVESSFDSAWNPYDGILSERAATGTADAASLAELEHRCPPVPGWLHL